MFDSIIAYSVRNKLVIGMFVLALLLWGLYSLRQLPVDAVPDITNNQVQIITSSPTLATQEVEQFITTPVELALQNLQDLEEIRSISRFGLSVVTVVFDESTDVYLARQLVSEHLREAEANIPAGLGTPEMAPISTGLGEIYQYIVRPASGYEDRYSATELRSIQDWIISRQLSGIEGVVEVNALGGYLKQYEVAVDPAALKSVGISMNTVFDALSRSNENSGGAYIEKNPRTYYIRTDGLTGSLEDIGNIVVDVRQGRPILIRDLGTVRFGSAPRYGAATSDGQEVVSATVMMLKGANSAAVTDRIKERMEQVRQSLPEGVIIEPYLDRDKLISTAIGTVKRNLIEGGLIVVFILVLLLGNWRAGLIVASVIPLAMLFAVSMMNVLGISANLMSLGAIDFGLIVDGAVIIVEAIVHRLRAPLSPGEGSGERTLTQPEMDRQVTTASIDIRKSAAFGETIILIVYLPILALVGIEGKMFRPMAQTVMLAIAAALVLSLTYVPMVSALFLSKTVTARRTLADRIIAFFQRLYAPALAAALRFKTAFVVATVLLFGISLGVFTRMGGEFIPTLEEGDLALHQILPPGTSLSQSVEVSYVIQNQLKETFPEIEKIVTKIGAAEIPTDPMPVETGDIIVVMKPKSEWTSADNRQDMMELMEATMNSIPGVASEYSQPIQMRFNELMTGSRSDIAIKLYGEDLDVLAARAAEAEAIIRGVDGVGTVKLEQTEGMPQLIVDYDYARLAQYGLQVRDVNRVIRAGFAGTAAGTVYEGDRRYDLTVRLAETARNDLSDVANLYLPLADGAQVPLSSVATVELRDAPLQISRDDTKRRIVIGVNVGSGTDTQTLVGRIRKALTSRMELPAGYYFTYGGQFENLQAATRRLAVAVPVALGLIFILLYFTFGSLRQAALIFVAIPLSAIGGVWALELRGMPFSISAGIGFIALFGVAVLNGIVLIGYLNQLKREGWTDVRERIVEGTRVRLRPVIMTASVASLGFLPMALSTSGGAEVQRPLATVVIGGLVSATFLTLIILPILYSWLETWHDRRLNKRSLLLLLLPFFLLPNWAGAQVQRTSREAMVQAALRNNPGIRAAERQALRSESLRNLPYVPGTLDISYNGDGLFRPTDQLVNQLTVIQRLDHPATQRAANALQEATVAADRIRSQLTAAELTLEVSSLYHRLQYQEALSRHYAALLTTYEEYYRIAQVRVETGEANRLEALTIEADLRTYRQLGETVRLATANLSDQLSLLTGTPDLLPSDTLRLVAYPPPPDTAGGSLSVRLTAQEVAINRADITTVQALTKPSFRLGYSAQRYYEGGYLSGLEAGVILHPFTGPARRRVEAQRLGVVVAEDRLAAQQLTYRQQLRSTVSELEQATASATFYADLLVDLNAEIVRVSRLNYRAGELSYLELLSALRLLAENRATYLEALLNQNLAAARLAYLTTP
ncbi:CusA/CzcA family heavy metal efflux RND transporter [Neolewinella sp.]|uniref:CusA/CzcA family heavy metal efflux RND transporter n=1 Tax=Neolewinella sp. TaxID=2993543 RepID=UPI003B52F8B9